MRRSDLVFLYGDAVPHCTHVIDKVYVGYQTLQYMDGGSVELWIDDRHTLLHNCVFWSAYPGPRFRFHAAPGSAEWNHRYLAFQGPLIKRWEREKLFPLAPRLVPRDAGYAGRFDALLKASRRSDGQSHRRAINLLEGILLELVEAPEPLAEPDWLSVVTTHLDNAAITADAPDYAALARRLDLSERTLRRRFRTAVGTSPHAYLLQRKVERARQLLGETDLPIKAIAARLGYADVYFFSRQFRQLAGVAPNTYRRSRQG